MKKILLCIIFLFVSVLIIYLLFFYKNEILKLTGFIECTSNSDCSETQFCDVSRPGYMSPDGFVTLEESGSMQCIEKCEFDSDCASGECANYETAVGDVYEIQSGCNVK